MTEAFVSHDPRPERGQRRAKRRRTRSFAFTALAALLAGALLLTGCAGGEGDGAAADSSAADSTAAAKKPQKEKRSSVSAATVIRGDLVLPITAEGSIRALHATDIRCEVSGRLDRLVCEEGQHVRAGQLLASIDDRDYQVALEEARTSYLQALGSLAVETETDEAWEAGGTSQPFDPSTGVEEQLAALRNGEYRREIAAARTGLASAQAAEQRARLNLERCEIRAPFSGVISGLQLTRGEWLSAGQTLFQLTDDRNLEAAVDVLESDMAFLEQDRPALIALPALQDTLLVQVDIISPRLDTTSRSCQVLMRFHDESGRVKPGMFIRAAIAGEILPDRILVPREAVLIRDNRPLVFKVVDGITQWLYVSLGERNERFVEIKRVLQGGSLAPGDQIVISDHLTLTHGARVKVKKLSEPVNPWRGASGAGE